MKKTILGVAVFSALALTSCKKKLQVLKLNPQIPVQLQQLQLLKQL